MKPSPAFSIAIAAVLAQGPASSQEQVDHWTFGGRGGERWADWVEVNVMADDFSVPGVLQPRELKPGENLLPKLYHTVPWERYQEPANPLWEDGLPRLWRWTGNRARSYYTPFSNFIDGDLGTFSWQSPATHVGEEWYTIDVGAPVPAERFAIRMPDGVDRIGRPWAAYVPKAGELSASLTETAILGEGDRPNWWEYQPLETVLGGVNQNLRAPIEISFPLQYQRFFRWITYPEEILASGRKAIEALAYAEMELFGRGFAAEARYVTRVVDAARPVSIGRLFMGTSRWRRQDGELIPYADADAGVAVRLKTGLDDDPRTYFTWNDQSEYSEIGAEEYQGLKPRAHETHDPKFVGWQGPVGFDKENWSSWTGGVAQSGTVLEVPSGRYFQVMVVMTSSLPADVARLDSLRIELVPLLVPKLFGEVGLARDPLREEVPVVTLGEPVELIYAIRALFGRESTDGFDAVHIQTPAEPLFRRLQMGDPPADVAPDSVAVDPEGLTLFLPRRVNADEELRIGLETTLYTVSAQFSGKVFNRELSSRRQLIRGADATPEIGADKLHVVAEGEAGKNLLADLVFSSATLTANGDGRNDRLQLRYTLFGVISTDVEVTFHGLDGRKIHSVKQSGQTAGRHTVEWDGTGADGRMLSPGTYLCRVAAETGSGRFELIRPVALVY